MSAQLPDKCNRPPEHLRRDSFEARFRRHFERTYARRGRSYREAAPAYHFGYDLAVSRQYWDQEWNQIQMEAQRLWEQKQAEPWEQVEPAVRFAWNTIRSHLSGSEVEESGQNEHAQSTW